MKITRDLTYTVEISKTQTVKLIFVKANNVPGWSYKIYLTDESQQHTLAKYWMAKGHRPSKDTVKYYVGQFIKGKIK